MQRFVRIIKASKPTAGKPTVLPAGAAGDYEIMQRIADELAPAFAARVTTTLEQFRATVNIRDILSALVFQDQTRVEGAIPWADLLEKDDFLMADLEDAVRRAGVASMTQLKGVLERTSGALTAQPSFDRGADSIAEWAHTRSSELIVEITDASRAAVRGIIADTIASGAGYEAGAKAIQDAVGLTTSQADAVSRFREGMEAQGLPDTIVDRRTEEYRDRQLRRRAETIARTETIAASNQGNLESWQQAIDAGIIDKDTAMKVWIVTPDDRLCDLCAPLDGVRVPFDDVFESDDGEIDAPPLHPNCRCSIALVFAPAESSDGGAGGDEGDDEE